MPLRKLWCIVFYTERTGSGSQDKMVHELCTMINSIIQPVIMLLVTMFSSQISNNDMLQAARYNG